MKVSTQVSDELDNLLESNIATPYVRVDKSVKGLVEYGYCLVDESNNILEKYMSTCEHKDIIIKPLSMYDVTLHMNITEDGYIRFWISNVNFYLKWSIDESKKTITLKIIGRRIDE